MVRVYLSVHDNKPPFVVEGIDDNGKVTSSRRTFSFKTLWPSRFVYSERGFKSPDQLHIQAWTEIDTPELMA